jgi:hypothetical protein
MVINWPQSERLHGRTLMANTTWLTRMNSIGAGCFCSSDYGTASKIALAGGGRALRGRGHRMPIMLHGDNAHRKFIGAA